MLSLPKSPRSEGPNGSAAPSSLANDTQLMVLEYLAVECMEPTFLSLVGNHPLATQCLNTVRLPNNTTTPIASQISPQVIQVNDSSDDEQGNDSSGDVTMSDYVPSPVKNNVPTRSSHFPATSTRPLSTHAKSGSPMQLVPIEHVIGRLSFHLRTLRIRKELKSLILKGQAQDAKSLLLRYFPHFETTSNAFASASQPVNRFSLLLARLDCQAFIELIRLGNHTHTLAFSQSTLAHYFTASRHPDAPPAAVAAAQLVGQVCGLIAYPDPYVSPLADCLDAKHRQRLAEDVNWAVLASADEDGSTLAGDGSFKSEGLCGGPSALEKVVRQAMVAVMAKGGSPVQAREAVLM